MDDPIGRRAGAQEFSLKNSRPDWILQKNQRSRATKKRTRDSMQWRYVCGGGNEIAKHQYILHFYLISPKRIFPPCFTQKYIKDLLHLNLILIILYFVQLTKTFNSKVKLL